MILAETIPTRAVDVLDGHYLSGFEKHDIAKSWPW
jgi:hypothetical protein